MGNLESNPSQHRLTIENRELQLVRKLGEGGYSFVFLVQDVHTGQKFALKRMLAHDKDTARLIETEISMMKQLNHVNIVKFYGSMVRVIERKQMEYFILMENCSSGSLFKFLKAREDKPLTQVEVLNMFVSICRAVRELHCMNPPITHRDLKIENILIGEDLQLKLCDFGSCTTREKAYTTQEEIAEEEERIQKFSTPSYRAPEMCDLWSKAILDVKTDIWALGCIFYILMFFRHPFFEGSRTQIVGGNYTIPKSHGYSEHLIGMLKGMLHKNSRNRPSCDDLILYCEYLIGGGTDSYKTIMSRLHPKKATTQKPKKKKSVNLQLDASFANFEANFNNVEVNSPKPLGGNEEKSDEDELSDEEENVKLPMQVPEAKSSIINQRKGSKTVQLESEFGGFTYLIADLPEDAAFTVFLKISRDQNHQR